MAKLGVEAFLTSEPSSSSAESSIDQTNVAVKSGGMEMIENFSQSSIIELCARPVAAVWLNDPRSSNRVLKLSQHCVVKYGPGVTEIEADNQRRAFELLDPAIVRVPRVYSFFTHQRTGYLLMEFIEGERLSQLSDAHFDKLIAILTHFRGITGEIPGNLCGKGVVVGNPFPDDAERSFATKLELEAYFGRRLLRNQSYQLNFASTSLVFTHRDLAPRNIIWLKHGSVCLLDWMTGGFFPPEFELCNPLIGAETSFGTCLRQAVSSTLPIDLDQVDAILQAWMNCFRYRFKENIEEDITQGPCLTDMVHDLDMYSSTENIIPEDVMNEFLRVSATENERMIAS